MSGGKVKFTWTVTFESLRDGLPPLELEQAFNAATVRLAEDFVNGRGLVAVQGHLDTRFTAAPKGKKKI